GVAGITIMMGDNDIIIIIAIIAAIVIIVLFICIIIYLICRRKRQAGKYPEVSKPNDPNNSGQGPKDNGIPVSDEEPKQFYENLPFHGMQQPPNKPFLTDLGGGDLEYADVDYATYTYGPIPYKQESKQAAEVKKAEQAAEQKGIPVRPPRKK
ncbi:unnamed protein product, partial [Meganyctiphanes norvegica]